MGCIVNMFLEKVFNLGYVHFSHNGLLIRLLWSEAHELAKTCASRLVEEKTDETNQTYFYPPFNRRTKNQIAQAQNVGF